MNSHQLLTKSLILALITVAGYGCNGSSLKVVRQVQIEPNAIESVILDAISQPQTIKVTAKADVLIVAHIHLVGDEDAVDRAVTLGQESDKIIAASEKSKEVTIEGLIPANKEAVVRLQCCEPKSTTVDLLITN